MRRDNHHHHHQNSHRGRDRHHSLPNSLKTKNGNIGGECSSSSSSSSSNSDGGSQELSGGSVVVIDAFPGQHEREMYAEVLYIPTTTNDHNSPAAESTEDQHAATTTLAVVETVTETAVDMCVTRYLHSTGPTGNFKGCVQDLLRASSLYPHSGAASNDSSGGGGFGSCGSSSGGGSSGCGGGGSCSGGGNCVADLSGQNQNLRRGNERVDNEESDESGENSCGDDVSVAVEDAISSLLLSPSKSSLERKQDEQQGDEEGDAGGTYPQRRQHLIQMRRYINEQLNILGPDQSE
jgi:hypothetical protein